MQDEPPKQMYFSDEKIPRHVTYAYHKSATIAQNDDFYTLSGNQKRTVGILFLIANAPVNTGSVPEHGALSNAGLALAMELAMNELTEIFPFLSPRIPRCTGPNADPPLHGTVNKTNRNKNGSTAVFGCKDGFAINAVEPITCIALELGATWPAPNISPKCEGVLTCEKCA